MGDDIADLIRVNLIAGIYVFKQRRLGRTARRRDPIGLAVIINTAAYNHRMNPISSCFGCR